MVSVFSNLFAQNNPVHQLSLLHAQEIALKNSNALQASRINEAIAINAVDKVKKDWLPEITANGDLRYNTQLESMVFDGFGNNGGNTKIQIGTKNLTVFSLDLTQPIYKPTLGTDKKIAENNALLESEKNIEKRQEIRKSVAEAYLNVLLKQEQYQIAQAATARNKNYVVIAENKFSLKVFLENDLLKAKLDLKNAEQTATKLLHNYEWAIIQLKYRLDISYSDSVSLNDNLATLMTGDALLITGNINLPVIRQLKLQQTALEYEAEKNRKSFLPVVNFVANYTAQFQSEKFNYFNNPWSPFNYIGIKASVPLMAPFRNASKSRELNFKMKQLAINTTIKQKEIDHQVLQYQTDLVNAENALKNAQANLDFAKQLYQAQLNTYRLGTTTYNSTLDSEVSVQTAEQNYIKAVYNYLVAKLNLDSIFLAK